MISLNLYKRRADHILYVVDYMLVHFGLAKFIGNIDWSINVPGKHASDAK